MNNLTGIQHLSSNALVSILGISYSRALNYLVNGNGFFGAHSTPKRYYNGSLTRSLTNNYSQSISEKLHVYYLPGS